MTPYFQNQITTLYQGDCRTFLKALPDESVNTVVMSPPYFGLRDYGVDGQLGLEQTPDDYVEQMVSVFSEVRRVLRTDGTLFLNLGDSYANDGKWGGYTGGKHAKGVHGSLVGRNRKYTGLKPKDLIGIPWMVAFALRADGWFLRSDIIWHKPNPMPESVKDRPTRAHEYIFLLTKSSKYFYDADAIKEPVVYGDHPRNGNPNLEPVQSPGQPQQAGITRLRRSGNKPLLIATNGEHSRLNTHLGSSVPWASDGSHRPQYQRALEIVKEKGLTQAHIEAIRAAGITDTGKTAAVQTGTGNNTPEIQRLATEAKDALGGYYREFLLGDKRNKRSVWTVHPKPYKDAHFAVFPPELIKPCILAGCPVGGTVLDPFAGSGTTLQVAMELQCKSIGIELNPDYCKLIEKRFRQPALMFGA